MAHGTFNVDIIKHIIICKLEIFYQSYWYLVAILNGFYEIKFEHWQRNVNENPLLVMPSLTNIQIYENIW
jgi:hypothetical protein